MDSDVDGVPPLLSVAAAARARNIPGRRPPCGRLCFAGRSGDSLRLPVPGRVGGVPVSSTP